MEYMMVNGYQIPALTLNEPPMPEIGKYGSLRRNFLRENAPMVFDEMMLEGLMDAPLLERPTADYIKMSRQIAALGNNLNQLAHIANASGKVSDTDLLTAKQIMEQIWRYIKGGGVQ